MKVECAAGNAIALAATCASISKHKTPWPVRKPRGFVWDSGLGLLGNADRGAVLLAGFTHSIPCVVNVFFVSHAKEDRGIEVDVPSNSPLVSIGAERVDRARLLD